MKQHILYHNIITINYFSIIAKALLIISYDHKKSNQKWTVKDCQNS